MLKTFWEGRWKSWRVRLCFLSLQAEEVIAFDASKYTEDAVLEAALDAGAEDVESTGRAMR